MGIRPHEVKVGICPWIYSWEGYLNTSLRSSWFSVCLLWSIQFISLALFSFHKYCYFPSFCFWSSVISFRCENTLRPVGVLCVRVEMIGPHLCYFRLYRRVCNFLEVSSLEIKYQDLKCRRRLRFITHSLAIALPPCFSGRCGSLVQHAIDIECGIPPVPFLVLKNDFMEKSFFLNC